MCSIISKHTFFLLKVDLHCNLSHFRNVSNTSVQSNPHKLKSPDALLKCSKTPHKSSQAVLGARLGILLVVGAVVGGREDAVEQVGVVGPVETTGQVYAVGG